MINLVLWLSVIWLPVLMYAVLRNETKFKKNIAVGVTLPIEAREDGEVQSLLASFKKEVLQVCAGLIVIALPCILIRETGPTFILWCVWLDIAIILPYVPYVRCNRRMKRLKQQRGWNKQETGSIANISAAAMPVRWLSPALFLLPFAVSLLPLVWERMLWPMYLSDAFLVLLCFLGYRYLYRNKAETVDGDLAVTEALTRIRRYNWGKCWLLCAWMMALINICTSLTTKHPILMLVLILLSAFVIAAAIIGVEFRTRRMQEELTAESGSGFYVDEDDRWIWGLFYYNADDSHLIVNQRVGINTTVNLARRGGKIITGAVLLFLLLMPLWGVWMGIESSGQVIVLLTEDAVTAGHAGTEYEIPLNTISNAMLLEELPAIQRIWGTGMNSVQKGSYSSEWGTVTVCLDPRTGPWLLLETEDQKRYLIGSSDGTAVRDIYETVSR